MKTNLIIILTIVSSIIFNHHTFAQRDGSKGSENMPKIGVVMGTIMDPDLNKPVEYATIGLFSGRDSSLVTGTISQSNGQFRIEEVPFGKYYIEVTFVGYEKRKVNSIMITPKNTEYNMGVINLKQAALDLDEFEITADKTHIEYKIDKKVINLGKDLVATGGSAVDVLENTPSVQTDIDGNVSLRGSSNFTVYIDGKPSVIGGSDALQQIPASTIDKIEIITNPSAKYDPDGIAGIINVITKKQKGKGFNGIINATFGTGEKYGIDGLFNYRMGKINVFAGFDYNDKTNFGSSIVSRETKINDTLYYSDIVGDRNRGRSGYELRTGVEYDINNNDYLSLSFDYGSRGYGHNSYSKYYDHTKPLTLAEFYVNDNDFLVEKLYYSSKLFYQHKFKKPEHQITFSGFYSSGDGQDEENLLEYITDNHWYIDLQNDPFMQRVFENSHDADIRLNTDYVRPIGKEGKLEAGYQYRFNNGETDYMLEIYDAVQDKWTENTALHNDLKFSRDIHSAYTTYSNNLGKFDYMLGLRLESTNRILEQNILDTSYVVNRLDYFPTLHLSRKLKNNQQLMASYSKRIHRPREYYLDPFPNYMDEHNIRMGNPALEPENIHSMELSYQKRFKSNFISVETYMRQTQNKIQRITYLTDTGNILVRTFDNIDKDRSIGLEVMGNFEFTKWWTLNTSVNVFNYSIEGNLLDENVSQTINTWSFRLNTSFKLKWGTRIQLSGFYTGPSVTGQGDRDAFYYTNLGIRQDFLKNKLSATLQVRDIFGTMSHTMNSYGENFATSMIYSREPHVVSLTVTYKINNYKVDKRSKGGGDADFGDEEM